MAHFVSKVWGIVILALSGSHLVAQIPLDWQQLADVEVSYTQNLAENTWYLSATFSVSLKHLDQQNVQLTGYIIPDDITGQVYYLSAFPLRSCFFCGGAGPESIVKLELSDPSATFNVDEYVTFRGNLRLAEQSEGLIYTLASATLYK